MPSDAHTFLFMDLVGFSALTAERGDDSAADVALRLFASVRRVLPRRSTIPTYVPYTKLANTKAGHS